MFCDLVGSTALSARLDPEELREVPLGRLLLALQLGRVADDVAGLLIGPCLAHPLGDFGLTSSRSSGWRAGEPWLAGLAWVAGSAIYVRPWR
jgi:hypothetical protein